MTRIPGQTTEKDVLIGIEEQLKALTEVLDERNRILKSIIKQPEGLPARLVIGTTGVLEVTTF